MLRLAMVFLVIALIAGALGLFNVRGHPHHRPAAVRDFPDPVRDFARLRGWLGHPSSGPRPPRGAYHNPAAAGLVPAG